MQKDCSNYLSPSDYCVTIDNMTGRYKVEIKEHVKERLNAENEMLLTTSNNFSGSDIDDICGDTPTTVPTPEFVNVAAKSSSIRAYFKMDETYTENPGLFDVYGVVGTSTDDCSSKLTTASTPLASGVKQVKNGSNYLISVGLENAGTTNLYGCIGLVARDSSGGSSEMVTAGPTQILQRVAPSPYWYGSGTTHNAADGSVTFKFKMAEGSSTFYSNIHMYCVMWENSKCSDADEVNTQTVDSDNKPLNGPDDDGVYTWKIILNDKLKASTQVINLRLAPMDANKQTGSYLSGCFQL